MDGPMKQGQLMLYDNAKATWQKVHAVLTEGSGFSIHSTAGGGRGGTHQLNLHNKSSHLPATKLKDIKKIYRQALPSSSGAAVAVESFSRQDSTASSSAVGSSTRGNMLTSVMMVVETEDDLLICRTTEPKALAGWLKVFEELLAPYTASKSSSFKGFVPLDELRPLRSYFSPQIYSMLFKSSFGRLDPHHHGKGAAASGTNGGRSHGVPGQKMPNIPKNLREIGRRASLSAGTPNRGGTLPQRRKAAAALIPMVVATDATSLTPVESKETSPEPQPNTAQELFSVSKDCVEDTVVEVKEKQGDLSPKQVTPSKEENEEENKENPSSLSPRKSQRVQNSPSALSSASPNRALVRLSKLQGDQKAVGEHHSTSSKDEEVISNLKKQVESLTRRNIDLQVDNVNTQARLLELEEMVTEAQEETGLWKDKFASLQRQMKLTDENVETRIKREKQEWMQSLQEEVAAQWQEMKKKWEVKEAGYKAQILELGGSPGGRSSGRPSF